MQQRILYTFTALFDILKHNKSGFIFTPSTDLKQYRDDTMTAVFRFLWQKISKPLEILSIMIICVLTIILLVVIALAYIYNVDIPGLRGKTIWDWLQLLIIPAVLAVGGYLFNLTTSRNERRAAAKRDQTEREITLDNQREAALQSYIDKISELLLEKKLRESQPDDEVRTIARVRTLTTLRQLDEDRKGSVLQFLYESKLIEKGKSIITLKGADLNEADLRASNLSGANLSGAYMQQAVFFDADLSGIDLSGALLLAADLDHTLLRGANLSRANLIKADLSYTDLSGANLSDANLTGADLSGADLSGATLVEASLGWADLSYADLKGVTGITIEALKRQASSLKNATMPDGTKHQ